ncbi:MAG: TIR domain-containing protein [Clostridia bacterium]|nr:TIR domain-containing protein [Clostridia bacterium]
MKNVFFSFHYANDVNRANVVRNSWVIPGNKAAGFIDKADFEKIKLGGDPAIYNWIDEQLKGTSVTVVLIGEETASRKFVRYELQESYKRGNKIIGVYIHKIKDMRTGLTSNKGSICFGILGKDCRGEDVYFSQIANVYDWVQDDGYNNFGYWLEH